MRKPSLLQKRVEKMEQYDPNSDNSYEVFCYLKEERALARMVKLIQQIQDTQLVVAPGIVNWENPPKEKVVGFNRLLRVRLYGRKTYYLVLDRGGELFTACQQDQTVETVKLLRKFNSECGKMSRPERGSFEVHQLIYDDETDTLEIP